MTRNSSCAWCTHRFMPVGARVTLLIGLCSGLLVSHSRVSGATERPPPTIAALAEALGKQAYTMENVLRSRVERLHTADPQVLKMIGEAADREVALAELNTLIAAVESLSSQTTKTSLGVDTSFRVHQELRVLFKRLDQFVGHRGFAGMRGPEGVVPSLVDLRLPARKLFAATRQAQRVARMDGKQGKDAPAALTGDSAYKLFAIDRSVAEKRLKRATTPAARPSKDAP